MKFKIDLKKFYTELAFAKTIKTGSTLVIGMAAKGNQVTLYATNYNEEVSTVLEAEVIEEGDFIYFDYFVADNVSTLPDGELSVVSAPNKVVFSVGKHKRDASLYTSYVPPLLDFDTKWVKVDELFIDKLIHASKMCSSKGEKHFECVNVHKESGWIIGGDREKLVVIEGSVSPYPKTINIKESSIKNYLSHLKGGTIETSIDGTNLAFRSTMPDGVVRRIIISIPKIRYDKNVYGVFDAIGHTDFTRINVEAKEIKRVINATKVYGRRMKKEKELPTATFAMKNGDVSIEMVADLDFRMTDFLISDSDIDDRSTLRSITLDVDVMQTALTGLSAKQFDFYFSDRFLVVDTEDFHFLQTARKRKAIQ